MKGIKRVYLYYYYYALPVKIADSFCTTLAEPHYNYWFAAVQQPMNALISTLKRNNRKEIRY